MVKAFFLTYYIAILGTHKINSYTDRRDYHICPARTLFFQSERIQCPVFCITLSKGGQSEVTAVLRKTISQKKIPTKPGNGLIFKGLLLRSYGRISWIINRKGPIKPLKIGF